MLNSNCGQNLTTNGELYVMTADIVDCAEDGLRIQANDITLDCAGFRIASNTSPAGAVNGIETLGFDGWTVRNCTIVGFHSQIAVLDSVSENILIENSSFANASASGINITGTNISIINNNITSNFSAIAILADTNDTLIENNTIFNGSSAQTRIRFVAGAHRNIIVRNNTIGNYPSGEGIEFNLICNCTNITIEYNTIFNGSDGISLESSTPQPHRNVTVQHNNMFNLTGDAMNLRWNNLTAYNNTATNVSGGGIRVQDVNNVTVHGNTLTNVSHTDNVERGIELNNADNTTIVNNIINRTGFIGVFFTSTSTFNNFSNNTIINSGDEGILLGSGPDNNTFEFNTILDSGTIGISAEAGTRDTQINYNVINNSNQTNLNFASGTSSNITLHYNQLTYSRTGNGLTIGGDISDLSIIGNNASFNNNSGFSILDPSGTFVFEDNIANNNNGSNSGMHVGFTIAAASSCIEGNPCNTDEDCGGGALGGPGVCTGMFIKTCDCNGPGSLGPLVVNNAAINITNNTANNNRGIGLNFTGYNQTNFIDNTAINNSGVGILLDFVTTSYFENIFSANNSGEGIRARNSSRNTFNASTLASDTDFALALQDSQNNSIIDVTLNSSFGWLEVLDSSGNNLTNVTFNSTFGTLRNLALVTATDDIVVNTSYLNFTQGRIFLNSSNLSFLNATSRVTLNGVDSSEIQVAFDDANFVTCNATQCTNVNLIGSTLTFDVASFTTYLVQAGAIAFEFTKTDTPDPVEPGAQLFYTITITVTNGTLRNATVVDLLPASVTFDSSSPAPSSGNDTFTLGNLTLGTHTINITVNVSAGANGMLTNMVNLTFQNNSNYTFVFNESTTTTVSSGGGFISSGGSGGSSGSICPPSCMSLTAEQRAQSAYCAQRCTIETPQTQQPVETARPASAPSRSIVVDNVLAQEKTLENIETVTKRPAVQPTIGSDYATLWYLFFGIALIALVGLFVYVHHKHLKHIK